MATYLVRKGVGSNPTSVISSSFFVGRGWFHFLYTEWLDQKNLEEYGAHRYLFPMCVLESRVEEREVKGIYCAGPDFMLGVWEAGHITGGRTEISMMKPPGPCARRK